MGDKPVLGIMQPYFFPYLGHFSMIAAVDEWVVFDITQYTPKAWMNRNRILRPDAGWQYVSVPLSNSSISIKTYEARILDRRKARADILGKLSHYKKKAPYYSIVIGMVKEVFEADDDDSLVKLNVRSLSAVCNYLGIPFRYRICSEMSLMFPERPGPGGWALEICSQLGADCYVNPLSGHALFDPVAFKQRGIDLLFASFTDFQYDTAPYCFEPNLSILDVLMWNDRETVARAVYERMTLSRSLPSHGNEGFR